MLRYHAGAVLASTHFHALRCSRGYGWSIEVYLKNRGTPELFFINTLVKEYQNMGQRMHVILWLKELEDEEKKCMPLKMTRSSCYTFPEDIRYANILVDIKGSVKLADFVLARFTYFIIPSTSI